MASPAQFERRMRRLGARVEQGASRVVRETALAILAEVVIATPVDTGRARGNWNVGLGVAPDPSPEEQQATLDPSGQVALQRGAAVIAARRDEAIFLSNNVPYIEQLNAGSSAQAPALFVEKSVQAGIEVVRRARLVE